MERLLRVIGCHLSVELDNEDGDGEEKGGPDGQCRAGIGGTKIN